MTWSNLDEAKREFYRWFHVRRCGIWGDDSSSGQCPVLLEQRRHADPVGLRFYPEAIWGNPENSIWFMGVNPGQCSAKSSACQRVAERRACANTLDDADRTEEQHFDRHSLVNAFGNDHHDPVFADDVTSASLGLLLRQPRRVCAGDTAVPESLRRDAVQKLTILNTAHCKSPSYKFRGAQELRFWHECGERNLSAIRLWHPEFIVAYGGVPQLWLLHVVRAKPPSGWTLEGVELTAKAKWWNQVALLTCPDGHQVKALFLKHPSRNCLNMKQALTAFIQAVGRSQHGEFQGRD